MKTRSELKNFGYAAAVAYLGLILIFIGGCGQSKSLMTNRVSVEPGVSLEIVDWGGTGTPIILLAGLGHTAHVFDELAPELTNDYHLIGITRRGFGASSQPDSGYDINTLVDDIKVVMDSLNIEKVILAGHSLGGDEMTLFARKFPKRVQGLIYIEAAYSRKSARDSLQNYPTPESVIPELSDDDLSSIEGYRDYYTRINGVIMPLSEIEALYSWDSSGRFDGSKTPGWIYGAIFNSLTDPDYSGIDIPALAIYAVNYPITELFLDYYSRDTAVQKQMEIRHQAGLRIDGLSRQLFRDNMSRGQVVEIDGAGHSVYITHRDEVIAAIIHFLQESLLN
ncbi:MAG: alpha/beta hydrolase [candidate division Zixibacteria bacterium]